MDVNESIYIEGKSPKPHEWEPAQPWLGRYDHPLWKRFGAQAKGAGHGGMDFFVIHAFIEALKAGDPMPNDIYDPVDIGREHVCTPVTNAHLVSRVHHAKRK